MSDQERRSPMQEPPRREEKRESKGPTPAWEQPKPGDLTNEPERWREQP